MAPSIWDVPNPTGTSTQDGERKSRGSTPTGDGTARITARVNGPAGYGVSNGIPYGVKERDREQALRSRMWLQPAWADRLLAATRSALGR